LEATADRDRSPEGDRDYEVGHLMAYHAVVSLMQDQALAFGIDRAAIGLDDITPETDLV
jgi:hypothetical protein